MTDERHERLKAGGGTAFPTMGFTDGMLLRDWMAGQALAGYLAAFAGYSVPLPDEAKAARECYEYADAMLAARAEPK